MSKLLKLLVTFMAAIIVLMIAAVIFIVFFINPNNYKTQLNQHVSQKLGQEFAIRGNISWTLFPWLGLQAGDVRVNNAPGFGSLPLAAIKEMNIKVRLLPLLQKRVEVGKIALQGAELNLQKNKQGKVNWEGLVNNIAQDDKQAEQPQAAAKQDANNTRQAVNISISEISIQDSTINWFDEQANRQLVLSRLMLQTGTIKQHKPFSIELAGAFNSNQPAVKGNLKLKASVAASDTQYQLKNLALSAQLLDKAYQNNKLDLNLQADIAIDTAADTLALTDFSANVANLQVAGNITRKPAKQGYLLAGYLNIPEFNARQFLQAIGTAAPAMRNPQALQKVRAQFALAASDTIKLTDLHLNFDETSVLGSINIQNTQTRRMTMDISVNKLNASNYLAPATDKDAKSIMLTGMTYTGNLALPEAQQKTVMQRLTADGHISVGSVVVDKTQISNLTTTLNANQGIIKLAPINAQLYKGKYAGMISLDIRQKAPIITANQTFSGIDIAGLVNDFHPLTKVQVTGVGEVSAQITAAGDSWEQARRTLAGKVRFALDKGVLKGINLEHWLNVGTALYHHEPVPKSTSNDTHFGRLTGTMNIDRGVARNDDFLLQSTFMRVTGQGTVDLVNERLNYLFNAVKMNPANNQPRKDVIPIRVAGPFANLSIKPDVEQLLKNQMKKELSKQADRLKEKVGEQLDKAVGKDLGDKIRKLDLDKFFGQ